MRASEQLTAVFHRIDITPAGPVSLLGYFNDRVSTGVLDPLACRLAGFAARPAAAARPPGHGSRFAARRGRGPASLGAVRRLLFLQIDTCLFDTAFLWALHRALRARECGGWAEREVLVFANHTHTAPALARLYEVPRQSGYAARLVTQIASAAGQVARALAPAPMTPSARGAAFAHADGVSPAQLRAIPVSLEVARGRAEGLAFNRRWLTRDGLAITNPSRAQRAHLVGPAGPVDPELITLLFRDPEGKPVALFVSASNHTDTLGGEAVSADWTGVLEREVDRELGLAVPVFPLLGAQGDINHFDPDARRDQTCYEETQRLGRAYAEVVLASLAAARCLEPGGRGPALASRTDAVRLPGRLIPKKQLAEARHLLAEDRGSGASGALTAVELAAGAPEVKRVMARELLRQAPVRRRAYRVRLQAVRLGGVLFCAIPGEPFAELGLALKSPCSGGVPLVLPLGLAGGYYGYILPAERLAGGGYEALPMAGRLGGAAAASIVRHFRRFC